VIARCLFLLSLFLSSFSPALASLLCPTESVESVEKSLSLSFMKMPLSGIRRKTGIKGVYYILILILTVRMSFLHFVFTF